MGWLLENSSQMALESDSASSIEDASTESDSLSEAVGRVSKVNQFF